MSHAAPILARLRTLDDPSVDDALAAALPTADEADRGPIAELILERHDPAALRRLVECYDRLPTPVQRRMVRHAAELFRPIREACGGGGGSALNALELIRRSRAWRLVYLAADRMRHGDEAQRAAAGRCLLELARAVITSAGGAEEQWVSPEDAAFLLTAVEEAVAAYRLHRRAEPLGAMALLYPRPMPRAVAALRRSNDAAVEPMRRLLAEAAEPAMAAWLVRALAEATFSGPAAAGLTRLIESGQWEAVAGAGHILILPNVRRAVARQTCLVTAWSTALAGSADHPSMGGPGLVAWVRALPLERDDRVAWVAKLRGDTDRLTRLAALRTLIAEARDAAAKPVQDAITGFTEDTDPAIARVALWHLIHAGCPDLPRLLATLANSPHESVRELARRRLAPLGFERLWQRWRRLDHEQRLAAGRAQLKIDPGFHRQVAERLRAADRRDRLQALEMIGELNQGGFFIETLVDLLESEDAFLASAAARALGTADDDRAVEALERALHHRDARVRANAVESLDRARSNRHVASLMQMADSDDSRPRANAIAALMKMRTGAAIAALREMLGDGRAAHRRSALWLAEQLGLIDVARQVVEVAVTDPDPRLRERAEAVIGSMVHRLGEAGPLPQPTGTTRDAA